MLKSNDQESRLHNKMSKAKLTLPIIIKRISFTTCLKRFLYSIIWSKTFHADLDTSNHNINYLIYVIRYCLSKLPSITSNGIKYHFHVDNIRRARLQMMLIGLHR